MLRGARAGLIQGERPGASPSLPFLTAKGDVFMELSTGFSYFSLGLTALLLLFVIWIYRWVLQLANYCRDAVDFVQKENKRAVSLRRIAEVEATLTELSDAYDALLTSNKKLRARIGMRERRAKGAKHVDSGEGPLSESERASYKSQLRDEAKRKGLLR